MLARPMVKEPRLSANSFNLNPWVQVEISNAFSLPGNPQTLNCLTTLCSSVAMCARF